MDSLLFHVAGSPRRVLILGTVLACILAGSTFVASSSTNIHTTFHWHLQQPIYWPAPLPPQNITYQKAYDSIQLRSKQGGHPESQLKSIFGKADRVAIYQYRASQSLQTASQVQNLGASVSYAGDLIENVNSFAAHDQLGYKVGWNETYSTYRAQSLTTGGFPKLDLVSFPYHHALAPFLHPDVLAMEISIHKVIYKRTWNSDGSGPEYSKGYFPAEMSFSQRIIPSLVNAGLQWVIVSNNHISRCVTNYSYSPHGDNNNPPNKADVVNPSQQHWFKESVSRGCTPNNAVPYAYRPHYAKHVDPETGQVHKMIVVPAAQAMGWQDGYECNPNIPALDTIAPYNDPKHPMLVMFAHDGDNAFGGGYSYYMQCVAQFANDAVAKGYNPTTVQQYLHDFPVDEDDIVHVEDGAWINADGDFGAPRFINWNWPLIDSQGHFDIPSGWAVKERNWAVIVAGENKVLTAQQMSRGNVSIDQVQHPTEEASEAELAWHFFLPSLTSGYMYYGNVLDLPVKPTIAANAAFVHADAAIAHAKSNGAVDSTPPTIWPPMRQCYNPGGFGMGSLWDYKYTKMNNTFYIYTFVFDESNVKSVSLHYRIDGDGYNPISDDANEVYHPEHLGMVDVDGSGPGPWEVLPMTFRSFPKGDEHGVKFYKLPRYIADEWFIELDQFTTDQLIDYYVEAVDMLGNVAKSDIFHVYVNGTK